MGLFWTSKSEKTASTTPPVLGKDDGSNGEIPEDLAAFLDKKQSQLSDREFKDLLRRQSEKHALPSVDEEIRRKQEERLNEMAKPRGIEEKDQIPPQFIELPHQPNSQPNNYISLDVETYRRQNDTRESVLINCSEIQSKFYNCLARQTSWDRLQSVGRLQSDECTSLADFFVACSEVQKKAFNVFDYETLTTIDEMKTARKTIDKLFVESFSNVEDVRDRSKFNEYTKKLRIERESFHDKFQK